MKNPPPLSVNDCLTQIESKLSPAALFYGHGTDNSWSEAQWLISAVLNNDGVENISTQTLVSPAQMEKIEALLVRRINEKVPLAYLLNEAWFAGHCFYVDERVLVPRSPIAELIDNGFQPLLEAAPQTILDLCCGSGCIGIACALAFPNAQVILSDISAEALAVAEINIKRFALQERVSVRQSDLFEQIPEQFDLVVSNPPYVPQDEYQELPAEYHAEPVLGLVSSDEGLAIPQAILSQSSRHLNENGLLILETGHTWPALQRSLPQVPFIWLEFEYGGEGVAALKVEQLCSSFQKIN